MSRHVHTTVLPAAVLGVVAAAMLPYGSVTPWAQSILILGTFLIACVLASMHPVPHTKGPRSRIVPLMVALLLAWLAYQYVVILDSPSTRTTYKAAFSLWMALGAMVWASSRLCASRHSIKLLFTGLTVIGTAQAALGILGLRMDLGVYSEFIRDGRAAGTFSSGNSFGGFIALALLATVGLAAAVLPGVFQHISRRRDQLLHSASREDYCIFTGLGIVVALLLMITALLLSGSRGAGVTGAMMMVVAFVWIYYASRRGTDGSSGRLLVIFICIVLAAAAFGVGGTYVVMERRLAELGEAAKASLPRTTMWRGAFEMITNHPLGVGLGSFSARFPAYQAEGFNIVRVRHAHNDYLELMAELGIPGAALLFSLLAVLLIGTGKYLLKQHEGNTIWLRRGAFLAVMVGLSHAAVDFNLSSRPGVSVLFAVLLGAAISRPNRSAQRGHRRRRGAVATTAPNRGFAVRFAVLLGSGGLCILLALPQLQTAVSSVLCETSVPAFGGQTSPYFWLETEVIPEEIALDRLKTAAALAPKTPRIHVKLATATLEGHHRKREALADQLIARTPGLTKAVANHHVTIALRHEESIALQQAKQHVETALQVAPNDVDANAYLARILGGCAQLSSSPETHQPLVRQLLRQVRKSSTLAPNDATVCSLLFRGIFRAYCSPYSRLNPTLEEDLRERLVDVGIHTMRLNGSHVSSVLAGWSVVGVEPSVALSSDALTLDVIWKIYRHYRDLNDGRAAMQTLKALEVALNDSHASRVRFSEAFRQTQRDRYRQLHLRELCKWQLRTRQFEAYTDRQSEREALLRSYVSEQVADSERAQAHRAQFLALERLWNDRGLDPEHMLEYYHLAQRLGEPDAECAAIASPLALFHDSMLDPPECLRSTGTRMYAHRLGLLELKGAIRDGLKLREIPGDLRDLLDTQRDPDIDATLIRYASQLGLNSEARQRILRRLTSISPAHVIGMQFMGGRCELTGVSVDPNQLQTLWRFRTPVPYDLQVVVSFRDANNATIFARIIDFAKAGGLDFGDGFPQLGTVFGIDVALPHEKVSQASRLVIGLRRKSTKRYLYSSEGLPYCEIYDWLDLVYERHLFRDQVSPAPSVRKLLGIRKVSRHRRFSHNLGNVFNSPEYYPLVGKKRTTTEPPTWQPCLSSSGLVKHAVVAAREAFDANPHQLMFSLGINDGQDWCECEGCRALCPRLEQEKHASQRWWSEPYWTFVDSVARELQETHSDRRIGAIAYSNVAQPPGFTLASNITVYVCQDVAAHFDEREKLEDTGRLKRWTEVCSDVGLYTYAGLASWIFPRYCRDELATAIKDASELGIQKFYVADSWVKWIDGPLPWIVKELLKDPTQDPKRLQRQFCNMAYGPATEAMDTYFNYLQKVWQSAPRGKWFDGLYQIDEQVRRYPPDVRERMRGYIADAEKLAMGNPAILRRIAAVSDPLTMAEAFATENDLMLQIASPVSSMADVNTKELLLSKLNDAIAEREHVVESLTDEPWAPSVRRALSASKVEPTIDRWNRKQQTLISDAKREITLIRNAAGYGQEEPATGSKL